MIHKSVFQTGVSSTISFSSFSEFIIIQVLTNNNNNNFYEQSNNEIKCNIRKQNQTKIKKFP